MGGRESTCINANIQKSLKQIAKGQNSEFNKDVCMCGVCSTFEEQFLAKQKKPQSIRASSGTFFAIASLARASHAGLCVCQNTEQKRQQQQCLQDEHTKRLSSLESGEKIRGIEEEGTCFRSRMTQIQQKKKHQQDWSNNCIREAVKKSQQQQQQLEKLQQHCRVRQQLV